MIRDECMIGCGPCAVCKRFFTFDVDRVPSSHGEPICRTCLAAVNRRKRSLGMPEWHPLPGAYPFDDGDDGTEGPTTPRDMIAHPIVIPAEGAPAIRMPANGADFTLEELHAVCGGYIETVRLALVSPTVALLVVNEEGMRLELPLNPTATRLAGQPILGTVLLCPRRFLR